MVRNLRPDRIIIVDRDSADDTRDIALSYGCTILGDTSSLGSARMKGVSNSSADWIAFVDDDILLPPGFREKVGRFMAGDIGAVQCGAVSVHEPYRTIHLEELGGRMGVGDHYDLTPGERGFTNATLIRRELLAGLDLSDVDTWEDWVITQKVLSTGHRWIVVRPFVDHIHDLGDLAEKEGWNAAGILNLARTGRMPVSTALVHFVSKVLLALNGSIKYTVQLRNPIHFIEHMRFVWAILTSPKYILRVVPRLPKESMVRSMTPVPEMKNGNVE